MSWPLVKLSDCCEVVGGATPKREVPEYWDSPDVPWVTPKDVSDLACPTLDDAPEYISEAGFKSCSTSMLPKGSVLVTSRAPIGNIAIAGRDLCTNQGFKSLIPGESVDGLYLYYCMKHSSQRLQALGNGATFKEVSKKIVEEFEIPLPPLPEQKRIAAILDKADSVRRKRQQAIQLADDFLRAVFLDMFGDPVTNPKGWEVDALEQLSTRVTKGESPKWQGFEYGSEGVRFITSENVLWGSLDERMKYIPLEFHQKLKRSQVQEGDLLINLVGASVGRACLAELNGVPANINQAVSVTTLDHSRLLPEIALYQLLVPSMQRVLLGNVVDAARANISLADIRDLQMLVPPTDVQLAFLKVLGKVKKYIAVNSSFSGLNLFESLSHNAFSGQL